MPLSILAQAGNIKKDSTQAKGASDSGILKKAVPAQLGTLEKSIQNNKDRMAPGNALLQVKQAASKINVADPQITQKAKAIKSSDKLSFDLSIQEGVQYNPLPTGAIGTQVSPKFANVFSVAGNISAWGIPFNFNLSNGHNSFGGADDLRSSLFKFDLDQAKYRSLLQGDLQKYYDLRKNVFAGYDLTGYTQTVLKQKLKTQAADASAKGTNDVISQYVDRPENVTQLLSLNETQIKQKLHSVAEAEAKNRAALPADAVAASDKQNKALTDITTDHQVAQYLNDPKSIKELQLMNQEQIYNKLHSLLPKGSAEATKKPTGETTGAGSNVSSKEDTKEAADQKNKLDDEVLKSMSRQIFLSRASGSVFSLNDLKNKTKQQLAQTSILGHSAAPAGLNPGTVTKAASNSTTQNNNDKQIDSIAAAITGIKNGLQKSGFDVNKILAIQNATGGVNTDMPASQIANGFASNSKIMPGSFLSNVQDFKLGAYGNSVPGSTQGDDVFTQGTHITYKAGNIPITLGYGGVNDISSSKDAAYQTSNYNQSKSISYISLKINKGILGSSTLSIIGSGVNHISDYNNYAVPSSSSNNVAFTISKLFNAGDLGKFTVDVSRSTTLAYRDLTPGADDIVSRRAGLDYSGSNLTEALSFGFNHQLAITKEGLNETVYFNYSGMGYQNPGNNGVGGGGMKMGGNVKKALLKNKLTLTLRTDLNNRSISYTSNDEWKSYNVQLDGRYTISKKFNVSLKYLNSGTDKEVDNINTPVYNSQKYQVDGNATYKIGKNYSVSHITIGKQDFTNTYVPGSGNSSMLMVNYTQSLLLHANSLTANVFYNKELTSNNLIGNMLNSDVVYKYMLFGSINVSTGVTYLDNTNMARQAGIKQGIQILAGKHFDVDTYVDLRHNLITPVYADLYSTCRAELSLKYYLKN